MASKRKKLGFFHLRKILFTGIMLHPDKILKSGCQTPILDCYR